MRLVGGYRELLAPRRQGEPLGLAGPDQEPRRVESLRHTVDGVASAAAGSRRAERAMAPARGASSPSIFAKPVLTTVVERHRLPVLQREAAACRTTARASRSRTEASWCVRGRRASRSGDARRRDDSDALGGRRAAWSRHRKGSRDGAGATALRPAGAPVVHRCRRAEVQAADDGSLRVGDESFPPLEADRGAFAGCGTRRRSCSSGHAAAQHRLVALDLDADDVGRARGRRHAALRAARSGARSWSISGERAPEDRARHSVSRALPRQRRSRASPR